jgi:hypothetical protein
MAKVTRYITRRYTTTDAKEAERFAADEGAAVLEITEGLDLVHAENGWALWSDGKATTSTGLTDAQRRVRSLTPAAVRQISDAWASESGPPRLAGGYETLARIAELVREEVVEQEPGEPGFSPSQLLRFDVRMRDGAERSLWVFTASYAEGYRYDVHDTREQLDQALAARRSRGDA